MKITALILGLAFVTTSIPAFASVKSDLRKVTADTQKCLDNPENYSTAGMNMCLGEGYGAADKVLNQVYSGIVEGLKKPTGDADGDKSNAEILGRLVQAQRAWIKFRDEESNLQGIEMLGGTGETQIVLGSLYSMTKTRALQLDKLLGGERSER